MGILDPLRRVLQDDPDRAAEGPAAAAGDGEQVRGQRSDGGSGYANAETAEGGADAVPDTPDGVAEDYT